jgi:glycosyltransferase involved in cell wall biosynthesis
VDYYDWESFNKDGKGGFNKRISYINYKWQHNFLLKFFNGGIVLSRFLRDHFVKLGLKEEQVCLQPHLVDMKNFEEVKNTPIFSQEITSFGVLGSINHFNGITDLLIAYKNVSEKRQDVALVLIGGSEDDYKYCKDVAQKHQIKGRIDYVGKIHYNELAGIMKKCDVFILPRPATKEAIAGFPTKVGEFCSSVRPLIITNYGDIPLYFKDKYNALLANPGDPPSLASKMLFVLENREEAKKIAENGYQWVVDTIEFKIGAKKIDEFLGNYIK